MGFCFLLALIMEYARSLGDVWTVILTICLLGICDYGVALVMDSEWALMQGVMVSYIQATASDLD